MRKINFLLAGIATLFMASCSNDEPANNNGGGDGKGGNESYLAIKIVNPVSSRAQAGYIDGTGDETKINSIVFYLFNEDGSAFDLLDPATGNSLGKNQVIPKSGIGNNTENNDADDIEGKYKPVLVLTHRVGEIPAYIAAVANAPAGLTEKMSEDDLKNLLKDYGTDFIMSNAMIAGGKFTEVKAENLSTDAAAAEKNPICINIERVVARLDVNLAAGATDGLYEIANTEVDNQQLYARLDGWALNNQASTSYLFKNVNFATAPNWVWSNDYRSFWANTTGATITTNDKAWNNIANTTQIYLQENTDQNKPTTLIVKATIGTKGADGNLVPVTVAQWNGIRYAGETALKTAMVDYLNGQPATSKLYIHKETTADGRVYETIPAEALTFVVENPDASSDNYQVVAKLVDTYKDNDIYTTDGKDFTSVTVEAANAHLKNMLKTALIWGNSTTAGATYYEVPILHTIADITPIPTGIVRNHVYQINIKSVGGLGTPVYNPDQVIIPDKVEFENSSMYAEVRVLSWRVVTNDVDLGK